MLIKVKPLGVAKAYLKKDLETVELPEGAKIKDLLDSIIITADNADLSLLDVATFLVNKEPAQRETGLQDGDEVIIMLRLVGG
ncbi:MAG: MoaD/ThiS family protein [Firmicutes bacterium]|nr:MoaD/ThiS family protein [Bacillota bacterium]